VVPRARRARRAQRADGARRDLGRRRGRAAASVDDATWDLLTGRTGADVGPLDTALGHVLRAGTSARLAFAGFSDGASYALSLGLANGELAEAVLAFSPGFVSPPSLSAGPRCWVAHGTADTVLPVDRCGRRVVALLERQGYPVHYEEFDGRARRASRPPRRGAALVAGRVSPPQGSPPAGHVFVAGADLTRLACDDVVGADRPRLQVDVGWLPLLPDDAVEGTGQETARVRADWPGGGRAVQVPGSTCPRAWLVDTVGDEGRGWMAASTALARCSPRWRAVPAGAPAPRPRPQARRPARASARGGASRRATAARCSAGCCRCCARRRREHGYDVALVLRDPRDLAAAQQVRRAGEGAWDLPPRLRALAETLGRRGREGELALFVGAGVSAAAGLPTWTRLLEELAELCDLEPGLRAGLAGLPPQDSAALLARELGHERLATYIGERFADRACTLAHAALAGLPVTELVTTNYDRLLEVGRRRRGSRAVGPPVRRGRPPAGRGCSSCTATPARPDSVVLTREQYLRSGDNRAALAGVLHALLLTRHVLFVGASMLDDDLIRIAHDVRSALQSLGPRRAGGLGTVLALHADPARARLWERDVDTVAVGRRRHLRARGGPPPRGPARPRRVPDERTDRVPARPRLPRDAWTSTRRRSRAPSASSATGCGTARGRPVPFTQVGELLRRLGDQSA
jgi:hypothetical protein